MQVISLVCKLVFGKELLLTYWQEYGVFPIMTLGMVLVKWYL